MKIKEGKTKRGGIEEKRYKGGVEWRGEEEVRVIDSVRYLSDGWSD